MKSIYINCLIIIFSFILLTSCNGTKSQNVVIIQSTNKMFSAGDPPVTFKSYGAIMNYFSPGAIVACKVDYEVLNQKCLSGNVYRITKDSILVKLELFDTNLSVKEIATKYLYTKDLVDKNIEIEEVDMNAIH